MSFWIKLRRIGKAAEAGKGSPAIELNCYVLPEDRQCKAKFETRYMTRALTKLPDDLFKRWTSGSNSSLLPDEKLGVVVLSSSKEGAKIAGEIGTKALELALEPCVVLISMESPGYSFPVFV